MRKKYNMPQQTLLVWIDLEMTGLDATRDVILEIASVVTDAQLNVIAQGPAVVVHHAKPIFDHMNTIVRAMHTSSGLLDRVVASNISVQEAEAQMTDFIRAHTNGARALLSGNSIWNDRTFLQRYMPQILELLHYRMVDVSTVKELVLNWYPDLVEFQKKKSHRALDDIYESIAELNYYRQHYFV